MIDQERPGYRLGSKKCRDAVLNDARRTGQLKVMTEVCDERSASGLKEFGLELLHKIIASDIRCAIIIVTFPYPLTNSQMRHVTDAVKGAGELRDIIFFTAVVDTKSAAGRAELL